MVVVLSGVSGSGKSTIGRLLAARLGWEFIEGDEHHPPSSIDKMSRGVPLDDADRAPWIESLRAVIEARMAEGGNAVVACSALRRAHRERLARPGVRFVYLHGERELIAARLAARRGHFFDISLLASQFAALEQPHDAIVVSVDQPPEEIVREIMTRLPFDRPR